MIIEVLNSGSKGNCYTLTSQDNKKLIIECGVGIKKIMESIDYDIQNVVGCLLTHEHKDHSISLKKVLEKGIDVYSSAGTFEGSLEKDFNSHHKRIIRPLEQFYVDDFIILPFETQHDANEPLGFLINHKEMGTMLFVTDTYYIKYKFPAVNHFFIECNYKNSLLDDSVAAGKVPGFLLERITRSHFELENVKDFFRANDLTDVKTICLIHLSGNNSDPGEFKREIQRTTGLPVYIASTGLKLALDD